MEGNDFMNKIQYLKELREKSSELTSYKRVNSLFDIGSFVEIDSFCKKQDNFTGVVCGFGTIDGIQAYCFAQDPNIDGGAMSLAQANKIKKIYELALKNGLPIIGIFDSKGAHIDEGIDSMNAFAKLINCANSLSGVVPQIAVVLGVCTGNNAVLASMSDITIMAKDARFCLNTPSVYRAGENIGTAESAYNNGTAHIVAENDESCFNYVRSLLRLLPQNNLAPVPVCDGGTPTVCPFINCEFLDAEDKISLSNDFGKSAKTLLARINGITCGAVVTTSSNKKLDYESCVKISSFVRLCDSFSIPIVNIIDADGYDVSKENELNNGPRIAALLSSVYCETTAPVITVIVGRACGNIYTAFAGRGTNADVVYAFPDAVISPLNPEASVIVLDSERLKNGENIDKLVDEYESNQASAFIAAENGYLDDIITKDELRLKLSMTLNMLRGKRSSKPAKKHSNLPF